MSVSSRVRRCLRFPLVLAALALGLSACAGNGSPRPPCCYQGELTLARVSEVYLSLESGQRISISEAFPGFAPRSGLLAPQLPFFNAEISIVTFGALIPLLPQYDANQDGFIQEPELTVLYIREASIGLGHDVNHVGGNPRVGALVLPGAEVSGLVQYVNDNRSRMSPGTQEVFRDLVLLGQQVLIESTIVRDTMD